MFDFTVDAVGPIETLFDQKWSGGWRRLRAGEESAFSNRFKSGWRLDLPLAEHRHPSVDYLCIFMDADFPYSEIRIAAPGTKKKNAPIWPHVEDHGLLCLRTSALTAGPVRRLELAISDAVSVLSMDDAARRLEFHREFGSYWIREATSNKRARSIVTPGGLSRDVVYAIYKGEPLFADSNDALRVWLNNAGEAKVDTGTPTRLIVLSGEVQPMDFPQTGDDVFRLAGPGVLEPFLTAPAPLRVLLGVPTPTGSVFGSVTMNCPPAKDLTRGFRSLNRVPATRIRAAYAAQKVSRSHVMRMDQGWIHGRDHDRDASVLAGKSVAIIGCGALGSEIAHLLAESGTGHFCLVDGDWLSPQNTSRHLLGSSAIGQPKANALADYLARAFPHMKTPTSIPRGFERADAKQLSSLAQADLIVTAGLTVQANIHIDRWRNGLTNPPKAECCWTEEFACAGHAVAFGPGDSVLELVDETGRPRQRLTRTWPDGIGTLIEAGCGDAFQPYGAADMLGTVGVSVRLAIDLLLDKVNAPVHRIWMGNRDLALQKGAELSEAFTGSYQESTLP
jgi:hypothetical protein